MKQLLLMRHGDAERGAPEMSDHARPLSEEGRKEAARAGAWLQSSGKLPAQVICSSAARTRQTLEALGLPEGLRARAIFSDQLYLASPGEMLQVIQAQPDNADRLLLIGHNPGIRDFCTMFAREGDPAALESVSLSFKTGALAEMRFSIDEWRHVPGDAGGKLEYYLGF